MQSSGDFTYATVSADSTALHAFYDSKSAVVFEAAKGMPLKVVAEVYPWAKVQIPGGLDLWVYKSLASLDKSTGLYHVNGSRTRSRPLPSTASNSHPLGVFPRHADLVPLLIEEQWVKVRAPESMSAWVLASAITTTDSDLSEDWQYHAEQRQAISIVDPVIVKQQVVEVQQLDEAIVPVEAAAEVVAVAPKLNSFDEGAIAIDPNAFFSVAIPDLEKLSDMVVKDFNSYDFETISLLETQLAYVLWHSNVSQHVGTARDALAKIDGLRNFYLSRINSQIIDTPLAEQGKLDPTLRKLRDRAMFSRDTTIDKTDIVVGWLEFIPRAQSNYPFKIVRGKSQYLVQSFDSHYKLRDFANRQVIARGNWRKTTGGDGLPVFAISELRIMPSAKNN
ncbi:MAG: hypothetical protein H8E25_05415 [Planctomycetes bacterium]|nr:hypothetical protein [Planctomycetota bacterium]